MADAVSGTLHFDDFEHFASLLEGWNVRLRKLDARPFSGSVRELDLGDVRLVRLSADSLVEVEGLAACGMRSFGLAIRASSSPRWCGQAVTVGRTVQVYGEGGCFDAVVPPGFESFIFSVADALLEECRALRALPASLLRFEAGVMECDATILAGIACLLKAASDRAGEEGSGSDASLPEELLRFDAPGRMLEALESGAPPCDRRPRLRGQVLRRARDVLEATPDRSWTVSKLCRAVGTGERTLRRAFLDYYGVAPRDYLKARRLGELRKALREADPAKTLVSDAANHWGFWHMGQLAADYRRLFGELPSETLRRA